MSERVLVVCPHCRKPHITSMLYVEANVCPSCGLLYDSKDLVRARRSVMAKYVPKVKR